MTRSLLSAAPLAVLLLLGFAAPAGAQSRTWVSGVGSDSNPCSRTAPCKTFAGAIAVTAAGGEISVLDPGGFGTVTITKSIHIVAEGFEGGVLAAGTNGIVVNAAPTDIVYLKGLKIEGAATGLNGIRFLNGAELHVDDCTITNFRAGTGYGIDVQAPGPSRLLVSHSTLADNVSGIFVHPTGGAQVSVFVDDAIIKGNSGNGVDVDGADAEVTLNETTVTQNGVGLSAANGGEILSFGNNALHGNGLDGKPTGKAKLR